MHSRSTITSRICRVLIATVLAVSTFLATTSSPAYANPAQDEAAFVDMINNLRASKGLGTLQLDVELTAASRVWAQNMSAQDRLYHAPDISAGVTSQWRALGENVGVSSSPNLPQLFEAFVQSPLHYKNLVDPRFTHVGVGVVYAPNGKLWTTHRFMQLAETPQTTQPPPTTVQQTITVPKTTLPATTQAPVQTLATAPPQPKATQPTTTSRQTTVVPTTIDKKPTTTTAKKQTPPETATIQPSNKIILFEPKYTQTELRAKAMLETNT